jgi:hypothetical protein
MRDNKTLSGKMEFWRAERPDEWTMDEFIRDAEKLEAATALQAERVRELEEALKLADAALRGKNINLKALSRRVNLALSATAQEG